MSACSAGASFAITNGMEYLMPPLLPYGHGDAALYAEFFDHTAHDVALQAATIMDLQCTRKFNTVKRMEKELGHHDRPWWQMWGADDFPMVSKCMGRQSWDEKSCISSTNTLSADLIVQQQSMGVLVRSLVRLSGLAALLISFKCVRTVLFVPITSQSTRVL